MGTERCVERGVGGYQGLCRGRKRGREARLWADLRAVTDRG